MKRISISRRRFVNSAPTLIGIGAASAFLPSVAAEGIVSSPAKGQRGGVAGKAFMQVTLYDKFSKENDRTFFEAVDKHYTSLMLKARGLVSYQRFRHFDLPQTIDIQLWANDDDALAFYDGAAALDAWKKALAELPQQLLASIDKDYLISCHSNLRRHYILDKTLKA